MRQRLTTFLLCVACIATWTLFMVTRQPTVFKSEVIQQVNDTTTVISKSRNTCGLSFEPLSRNPIPLQEGQADGVAILINMFRNLEAPSIWSAWMLQAFEYIKDMALEDTLTVKPSRVLRLFVHHSPLFTREAVLEMLPSTLNASIVTRPAPCAPANMTLCHHRLLQYAASQFSNAGYFLYVDSSTIPLKSFQHIYKQLQDDQRVRVTFDDPCYTDEGTARSLGALGYPKQVGHILLTNQEWIQTPWMEGNKGPCAPHECSYWKWAAAAFKDQVKKLLYTPSKAETEFDAPCETYDPRGKLMCSKVTEKWLKEQLNNDDTWFAHGLSDNTQVAETQSDLASFLANNVWKLSDGGVQFSLFKHPAKEIESLQQWANMTFDALADAIRKEKPWGLDDTHISQ